MKNDLAYQRFVILGTARTGSTLLWSYLNSHPEILCLRGVYGSTNKINFGKYYDALPAECFSQALIDQRNKNPISFLQDFVFKKYTKPYQAVGFKYFYDHDRHLKQKQALTTYFQNDKDIKFIHLKRENLLATLFSYKRALNQRLWTSAMPGFKTEISISDCKNYFQQISEKQLYFDALLAERGMVLTYETFISRRRESLLKVQKFLGVTPCDLTTEMTQNKNAKLSDSIVNYEELKEYFTNTKYQKYFE